MPPPPLIPMLSTSDEVLRLREEIAWVKEDLQRRGLHYNPTLPVGGMIEVPAAALSADWFAAHLDFLSIGTNDLIQYTLAIDRIDDEVNYLSDPLPPAVLRLLQMVIQAGRRHATPVAMCGEMAGDPRYTRLLLGLGLREFSMQPALLPKVKSLILESDCERLAEQVEAILSCHEAGEIAAAVAALNSGR